MLSKRLIKRSLRAAAFLSAVFGAMLLGPLGVLAFGGLDLHTHWSAASFQSTGQAPLPGRFAEPLVQIYGARTYHWRGAFGIHTWLATKRRGAEHYRVHQVIGWNLLYGGRSTVTSRDDLAPDFLWYGASPVLLAERRGDAADFLIDRIEAAVAAYPYSFQYRAWPGPNSNTFTAFVARQVPELGLDLPPNAIGKDYFPGFAGMASTPSGTGWQFSLAGLLGLSLALEEGIEFNLLGLSAGVDFNDARLRLPGVGFFPSSPVRSP